jgi:hypothetical protein
MVLIVKTFERATLVAGNRPTADILKATPKADNQWTDSA